MTEHAHDHHTHAAAPGGLQISEHGYSLDLAESIVEPGRRTVAFTLTGPDGAAVTHFEQAHGTELHLIAIRRDTQGFQHVHPVRDDAGRWTTDLDLTAGDWRLLADFVPAYHGPMTLGADLAVSGDYRPSPLPPVSATALVDGFTVTLSGELAAESPAQLTLSVSRDGAPVTDLEPYLEAYGHLVALRVGDLAYLHIHPEGTPGDGTTGAGPDIAFTAVAPSAGTYRLFLDFQHDGVVRTAEFAVVAARPHAHDTHHAAAHHAVAHPHGSHHRP